MRPFNVSLPASVKFDRAESAGEAVAAMLEKAAEAVEVADKANKRADEVLVSAKGAIEDVKAIKERLAQGPFDQAKMEQAVAEAMDKHVAELRGRGVLSPNAQVAMAKVTDPWNEKADYLAWQLRKGEEEDRTKLLGAAVLAAPSSETHRAFQRMSVDMQIVLGLAVQESNARHSGRANPWQLVRDGLPNIWRKWVEAQRAILAEYGAKAALDPIDTATSTAASEWIPAPMATEVREKIMLEARLANIFPRAVVRTPGKTWDIPVDLTDVYPDLIPETTAYTNPYAAADPTQLGQVVSGTKKTLSFYKHRARFMYSGEFDEDSIITALPFLRMKMFKTLANGEERVIVNGQVGGTIDTGGGGPGTYDIRKAGNGLRYFASSGVANVLYNAGSDNIVLGDVTGVRALMGEYGTDPSQLVFIPSVAVYLQLLNITEFKTQDLVGSAATALTGQLGVIQGMAVVPSREVATNLNASGIYDAVTTTQTAAIVAHRNASLLIAEKRDITTEVVRLPQVDQWDLIAMRRLGMDVPLGTTQKCVGVIYNIDTAVA